MAQKKKFKIPVAWIGRTVGMSVITIFAILVMVAVNLKGRTISQKSGTDEFSSKPALVSILEVVAEPIEITEKYSGTIRPLERFQLSFKTAGRVESLGENEKGILLDDGDVVQQGQVIAKLDTSTLVAQKLEIQAQIDFAETEFLRAEELRQQEGAISDSEYSMKKRELTVAQAQLKTLQTQIDDAVLKSPVDGIISKRFIKPGESVGLGQNVFEVIQVNQVTLVVGVPESKIHRMIGNDVDTESLVAYVSLIGQQRSSTDAHELMGRVRRVGQTSDDKSALFEVEILLENKNRKLRPGMIAIAKIVVEKIDGFRIPSNAVFERENETFVFVVSENKSNESKSQKNMTKEDKPDGWRNNEPKIVAKKLVLKRGTYEYQGKNLIANEIPEADRHVIVSGHRRLVDRRPITIVEVAKE